MIIAANFKMNLTPQKLQPYAHTLMQEKELFTKIKALIFPNTASLQIASLFEDIPIQIGAQNAYPATHGAFTGEIGAEVLLELGIHHLLIGHSERRELLKESQEFCTQKFNFYKNLNFQILYCIGESMQIRQNGTDALKNYLQQQLQDIDVCYPHLMIAYEPIWAIGTGVSATQEQIASTHEIIREILKTLGNPNIPLLYGGSVNTSNAQGILKLKHVDGVLIGGASLHAPEFIQICKIASSLV